MQLATLYREYEEGVNQWVEEYLGLQFSAQLSYNLPMDMLANIPSVDVPETESLDFSDLIDGYRQYSGPARRSLRRDASGDTVEGKEVLCGIYQPIRFSWLSLLRILWQYHLANLEYLQLPVLRDARSASACLGVLPRTV